MISGENAGFANAASAGGTAESMKQRFTAAQEEGKGGIRRVGQTDTYCPEDYFLGFLCEQRDAVEASAVLSFTLWNQKRLVLWPEGGALYTDLSRHQIRNLAATPLARHLRDSIHCQRLLTVPHGDELEGMLRLNLEETFWFLGYATSRGRLPESLHRESRLYLAHWPNFTRLPSTRNGMRIASVWAGESQRLDDIVEQLSIPAEDVYAFYGAASALGLTGVAQRQSDHVLEKNRSQAHPKKGVMAALMGHIGSIIKGNATNSSQQEVWSQEA
jgi:hypothetical protein